MKPFELELGDLQKFVQSADLFQGLDEPSRLCVRVAQSAETRQKAAFTSFPETVEVRTREKKLFQGSLSAIRSQGMNGVELEYRDRLDGLDRIFESEFLKGQRLQGFLQFVADLVGLRARFFGSFNQELPGRNVAGLSYLEHLRSLSSEYGFYFAEHSVAGELLFVALGANREKSKIDPAKVLGFSSDRQSNGFFAAAEISSFDSQEGKASKKELNASTLYESLGFLKSGGSFDRRRGWSLAQGRMEAVAAAGKNPEKHRAVLAAQLSKRLSRSEQLSVRSTAWVGVPGDRVSVELPSEKALHGDYLLGQVRTRLQSAAPVYECVLWRA